MAAPHYFVLLSNQILTMTNSEILSHLDKDLERTFEIFKKQLLDQTILYKTNPNYILKYNLIAGDFIFALKALIEAALIVLTDNVSADKAYKIGEVYAAKFHELRPS